MKILFFILIVFLKLSFAETNFVTNIEYYKVQENVNHKEVEKYLKEREEKLKAEQRKHIEESPIRRFEIQFFSSGAVIYLATMTILKIYEELLTGESSHLPDVQWYYIGINSIGIATYIGIKDYYENYKNKKINQNLNSYMFTPKLSILSIKF